MKPGPTVLSSFILVVADWGPAALSCCPPRDRQPCSRLTWCHAEDCPSTWVGIHFLHQRFYDEKTHRLVTLWEDSINGVQNWDFSLNSYISEKTMSPCLESKAWVRILSLQNLSYYRRLIWPAKTCLKLSCICPQEWPLGPSLERKAWEWTPVPHLPLEKLTGTFPY